jgi:hypothetical protein
MSEWNQPPADMPLRMAPFYTMGYSIPLYSWYLDESRSSEAIRSWTKQVMQDCQSTLTNINILNQEDSVMSLLPFPNAATSVLEALKNVSLFGKSVAILSSVIHSPWLAAILLNNGARDITIVGHPQHLPIIENRKHLHTISMSDFISSNTQFDFIFAVSCMQHLGLGRYGDELSADMDLLTMKCLHNKLRRLLFLSVPVGKDYVVWNAHRVYGPKRLPLLLEGFSDTRWIGHSKESLLGQEIEGYPYITKLPFIVLKKLN